MQILQKNIETCEHYLLYGKTFKYLLLKLLQSTHAVLFFQVDKCIGRWVLEEVKIYSPLSGVTTNQSEGFNTLLKQYQRWKEIPVNSLVHGLYRLQRYYYNEI